MSDDSSSKRAATTQTVQKPAQKMTQAPSQSSIQPSAQVQSSSSVQSPQALEHLTLKRAKPPAGRKPSQKRQLGMHPNEWNSFVSDRKDDLQKELSKLRKSDATPSIGTPETETQISASSQKVLGYATHFMAAEVQDTHTGRGSTTGLDDQTVSRLARGTEAMDYGREKLNKGRGNVDKDDPNFPEAAARTKLAYSVAKKFKKGFAGYAAAAELMRAGNCDQHASVTSHYLGGRLEKDEHVAKVVDPGHTFAELRGKGGDKAVTDKDVIVDSWAIGSHAVLREDSLFGEVMSPTSADKSQPYTQMTMDQTKGRQQSQLAQSLVQSNLQAQQKVDSIASSLPVPNYTQYDPDTINIASDTGQKNIAKREKIFNKQKGLAKNLQTVFTARQMGASVKGASRLATHSMPEMKPK